MNKMMLGLACSSAVLLAACGGNDADNSAADDLADAQGQRTIEAAAATGPKKLTTTVGTLVADKLGACTETVTSSWDIRLAACNAGAAQKFQFMPVSSDSASNLVLIKNPSSGLCVTARGSKSGSFVDLDDCNGRKAQQFRLAALGTSLAQVATYDGKLCLTAPTRVGVTEFSLTTCATSNAQQAFRLPLNSTPAPAPAPTPAQSADAAVLPMISRSAWSRPPAA
jgi:hypothetical protein